MFQRTPPRNKPRLIPPPPGTARCPECGGMASHGRPGNPNRRKDKSCPFKQRERLLLDHAPDLSYRARDPHEYAYFLTLDEGRSKRLDAARVEGAL